MKKLCLTKRCSPMSILLWTDIKIWKTILHINSSGDKKRIGKLNCLTLITSLYSPAKKLGLNNRSIKLVWKRIETKY